MRFYYILQKNSIYTGHLLRTLWDYFTPPPPNFSFLPLQLNVGKKAVFTPPPLYTKKCHMPNFERILDRKWLLPYRNGDISIQRMLIRS